MKKVISRSALMLFSFIMILESCSKTNSNPNQTAVDPSSLVVSGAWSVSSLTQRGEDKTSSFSGYVFTFSNGGSLKAEKSGDITTGTWSYTPSAVSYYGSTPSKSSITINLGNSKPFSQISRIWNVDSLNTNASRIALISPEVAEDMHLNFSKN